MAIKTINCIEDLNNEDLAWINKIDVHFDERANHFYSAWGVMGYWYDKNLSWNAEVEDTWELLSHDNKREDNKRLRRVLKELWGINPRKIKWATPYPQKWEDCFNLIASKKRYFFYSEILQDKAEGQYYNGFLSIRVEYDMLKNLFRLTRNVYISGDPEYIRAEFIKYIKGVKLPIQRINIDFTDASEETDG